MMNAPWASRLTRAARLVTVCALCASLPLGACCLPEVVLSNSWAATYVSKIVLFHLRADAIGGVYLTWCDDRPLAAFVGSTDNGASWQRPTVFRDTHQVPEIRVTADGIVVLLYEDDSGRIVSRTSFDQGGRFSAPVVVSDPLGVTLTASALPYFPQLALDDSGRAVAAWSIRSPDGNGTPDLDAGIWVSFSSDHGQSWQPPQRIGEPTTAEERTSWPGLCVVLQGGTTVVAWTENPRGLADQPDARSWVRRSGDFGGTWTPPVAADAGSSHFVWCAGSGSGGYQAMTYAAKDLYRDPGELAVISSNDDGLSWLAPPETLGWDLATRPPHLSALRDGRSFAVWRDATALQLQFQRSRQHGVPGSWPLPPSRPAAAAVAPTGPWSVPREEGIVDLLYEDHPPPPPDCYGICDEVRITRSCNEGTSWEEGALRLDDDADGMGESLSPQGVVSPDGRLHVAWVDWRWQTDLAALRYRALEAPPHVRPELESSPLPDPCGGARYLLRADPAPPDCQDPVYEWWRDDEVLPGPSGPEIETEPGLEGSHTYGYQLRCRSGPCFLGSDEVTLELTAPTSRVLGKETKGPLLVERRYPDLRFHWNDPAPEAEGYNLYRGDFRALHATRVYNHASEVCHLDRSPAGRADMDLQTPMSADRTDYYLLAPADCGGEGMTGFASSGVARPLAGLPPPCGPMP